MGREIEGKETFQGYPLTNIQAPLPLPLLHQSVTHGNRATEALRSQRQCRFLTVRIVQPIIIIIIPFVSSYTQIGGTTRGMY